MAELLDFTQPHVLRNEAEYTAAVAEIERLLDTDPSPHSAAYERLEFLSVLVQAYEDAHFPLEQLTTPQEVVAFMLEQKGRSHADLAQWLGGESHTRFQRGSGFWICLVGETVRRLPCSDQISPFSWA